MEELKCQWGQTYRHVDPFPNSLEFIFMPLRYLSLYVGGKLIISMQVRRLP